MLKLSLVTPEKKIVTDLEVEEIYIPGFKGELNILPGHAPLITTLEAGDLKYRPRGESKLLHAALGWGYCEVFNDQINILAETAELPEEIDFERAKLDLETANRKLVEGDSDPTAIDHNQYKVKVSQARLQVFDTRDVSKMNN